METYNHMPVNIGNMRQFKAVNEETVIKGIHVWNETFIAGITYSAMTNSNNNYYEQSLPKT